MSNKKSQLVLVVSASKLYAVLLSSISVLASISLLGVTTEGHL